MAKAIPRRVLCAFGAADTSVEVIGSLTHS
jgi:hypothetical protein